MRALHRWIAGFAIALTAAASARAEDGYELWMRYRPVAAAAALGRSAGDVETRGDSPTLRVAAAELRRGIAGLSGPGGVAGAAAPIVLASAADRAAFTDELARAVTTLVARYHNASAPAGRPHRLVVVSYPAPRPAPEGSDRANAE